MSDLSNMSDSETKPLAKLRSARTRAALAITWERLWPLVLPILGVVAAFLIISWFGLWPLMPEWARLGLLIVLAAGLLLTLPRLRHFRRPEEATIDRRVEQVSQFHHRPVSAQTDKQASIGGSDDPFARALWVEHKKRMAKSLDKSRSGLPTPNIAARDPFALRALVVLTLFVAFFAGQKNLTGHISDAFRSHAAAPISTARIDAWIRPPAYTNRPPVFLSRSTNAQQTPLEGTPNVPQGSELVLRTVKLENPNLTLTTPNGESPIPIAAPKEGKTPAPDSANFSAKLEQAGTLILRDGENEMGRWDFTIIPDKAPTIRFTADPTPSSRGSLEFAYETEDDYGIAKAQALVESLVKRNPDARPLIEAPQVPLSASRRKGVVAGKSNKDFSSHPWAGSKVAISLQATDDAGQSAKSQSRELELPGRIFTKPLAKAIVYERRRLALDANQQRNVADMLDIITSTHPDVFIPKLAHYTALRVAYRHIKRAPNDDALREGLELLWEVAIAIEDGALSQAQRALRDAQERLADALERGASEEEISKLMDELRQAMNEFMQQLAEQARKNPQNNQAMQQNQNMQTMRQQDLDRMMQQIEDLAKSGSKDAARELLRQMQEMMNNLQMAQPNQQQRQDPFSQQMNELSDIMRQQQELMDQTFNQQRQQQEMQNGRQQDRQQQQQGQNQQGQQGEQQQGGQPMTPEEFAEAMKQLQKQQGDLQKRLDEMQQGMRDLGMDPGDRMGEAGEAMGQAEGNLGEGQSGEATQNQGRALQAMRDGAQQMMRNMQNQAGEQGRRGERGMHGEQTRSDADPLGRQSRSRGPQLGDDTKVPGEIDAQRAREILEAIRKRLGETARPKLELDYLDRLLPTR